MTEPAEQDSWIAGRRRRMLLALTMPPAFALLILLLGTIVPVNPFWRQPDQGVRIYIADNGVHTDIVMPLVSPEMDWRPLLPVEHLGNPRYGDHIVVGFGDRDFYLSTPSWAKLSAGTALRAMAGFGDTVVHVEHAMTPAPDPAVRAITLSPDQYRALVTFIRGHFRTDGDGRPIWISGSGYGPSDTFYEADGRYNLLRTCNNWTSEALRSAGVRAGLWTPFPGGVMFWLP